MPRASTDSGKLRGKKQGKIVVRPAPELPPSCEYELDEAPEADLGAYRHDARPVRSLRLRHRWYLGAAHLPLLAFALLLLGSGSVWLFARGGLWIMIPLAIHACIGLAALYIVMAAMVNHTEVSVRDGVFELRHGPIPFRRGTSVPIGSIARIYSTERPIEVDSVPRFSFHEVHAELHDGDRIRIIGRLFDETHAMFIERLLEYAVGLDDKWLPPARSEAS